MKKKVLFGKEARTEILKGVDILADAVQSTLGARGRNVVIEREHTSPLVTKDGVTVAREITLEDPVQNIGAAMIRDVASRANDQAGDGTTTSTVLARAIYKSGLELVEKGVNPIELKRGMDKATSFILERLSEMSIACTTEEDLTQVASISANSDIEVGKLIAAAFDKVGKNGVVTVEAGKGVDDLLEVTEGMRFDRGMLSPYFATDLERGICELESPVVVLVDGRVSTINQMLKIMETAAQAQRPLVVIAEDFDPQVLVMMVTNSVKGALRSVAIKAPAFGELRKSIMGDIATIVGCEVISEAKGMDMENPTSNMFGGYVSRVVVTRDTTTIVASGDTQAQVDARVETITKQMEESTDQYDIEKYQERIAKLTSGIAVIRAGGLSEVEMLEKKDRIEDAINAARAALEEGIVSGGGAALAYITSAHGYDVTDLSKDQALGVSLVFSAATAPFQQIMVNGGYDVNEKASLVYEAQKTNKYSGFNVATGEVIDMVKGGIIDPVKVTRSSLQAAVSVAGMLLTTEATIINVAPKD